MTSKELKEYKNKYLSNFENEREVIISIPIDTLIELIENQEKLKQVIDILQVKRIQKRFLEESKNVDEYNKWISNLMNIRELTQEEYELLKEVLGNE